MGIIIWYKVSFPGVRPPMDLSALTISNDVFSGSYIVDADITLKMSAGDIVDTFEIKFTNLPDDIGNLLKDQTKTGMVADALAIVGAGTEPGSLAKGLAAGEAKPNPLLVEIHLGYFDDLGGWSRILNPPVMLGAVTSVKNQPNGDGILETTVAGQEIAGYRLKTSEKSYSYQGIGVMDLVQQIAKDAGVKVTFGPDLLSAQEKLRYFTLKASDGMAALRELAKIARVPLVVGDNQIYIGSFVQGSMLPTRFDEHLNIVEQGEEIAVESNDESDAYLTLTVLGDPKLRVGQNAALLKDLANPKSMLNIYITASVIHQFSITAGYTCKLVLMTMKSQTNIGKNLAGASGLVRRLLDVAEKKEKTPIDIGEVKEYDNQNHLTTLKYGQDPLPFDVAPSVETRVSEDDATLLINKPIVSPFAWHKCGLIVPVYPGMRALLAHNLGLVNDAVIAGFLWPENPTYERPKNEPGDYWLCLPTELDGDKQPIGKGVNDLTDKNGLRVIEAKGLRVFVGDDKLPEVGTRPKVPDAKTIVIEHESGTKITIGNDGALKIEVAKGKEISMTNSTVTLKLGSSGVEIS